MDKLIELKDKILKISLDLEKQYDLNFKHHCYLRIAYDNAVKDKWNNVIKAPFLNNCHINDLYFVHKLLLIYVLKKDILLLHNQISLSYRNKIK